MAEKIASQDMIIFCVGQEKFALTADQVKSIEELMEIVPVPRAPECVAGLINLRGAIVPVIDMRKRFKLSDIQHGRDVVILIVEHKDELVGLVVDKVISVERVSEQPKPVPESVTKTDVGKFYQSVLELPGEKITIVNIDNLLLLEDVK